MSNAILMAAGMGVRMQPLTKSTPKPLIKVSTKPMIETIIDGLEYNSIKNIYIVTGYKNEQFNYLLQKYNNIYIINNLEYETCNNISSLFAAKDILLLDDCFICESDLFLNNKNIFKIPNESCYYGKFINGETEDWVFDSENNYITGIHKYGKNTYCMVGVSYFTKKDAKILYDIIVQEYKKDKNIFWDEAVNNNIKKIKLSIKKIEDHDIYEIDTPKELTEIREKIKNKEIPLF